MSNTIPQRISTRLCHMKCKCSVSTQANVPSVLQVKSSLCLGVSSLPDESEKERKKGTKREREKRKKYSSPLYIIILLIILFVILLEWAWYCMCMYCTSASKIFWSVVYFPVCML